MNIDEIIFFQENLYNDFLKQDLIFLKTFSKKLLNKEIVFINIIENHICVIEDSLNKIKDIGEILNNIKDYMNVKNEQKKEIINICLECKNILENFVEINKNSIDHYNIILNFYKNY
jgi:hypothetical protein